MSRFDEDKPVAANLLNQPEKHVTWVLPSEIPIGFLYGDHPHAVMMATPADLNDFAIGFSLAEGIIHQPNELQDVSIHRLEHGIELRIHIVDKRLEKLKMHGQRRAHRGRAGCGICGVDTLSDALRPLPKLPNNQPAPNATAILNAITALPEQQIMRTRNHTVHGAAWVRQNGELALVREDIGRHNALDKMIGAWAKTGLYHQSGFALLSSRCTYELVQKCALAGINTLVCLAAPTANAVETAKRANMRLMIFERKTKDVLEFSTPV